MHSPRIAVVGSANADLVTRLPRCPKPGESLIGHAFTTVPGGKGANQAVAAARLGAVVSFAGCVGNDALGDMLRTTMAAAGVDVSRLEAHHEEPTGMAVILIADDGQNSIVVTPAANRAIDAAKQSAWRAMIDGADALMVQLEINLDATAAALELARELNVLSVLDAGPAQKMDGALLQLADVVSPNETEAEALTGIAVSSLDDARRAARCLQEMGARDVVMKLGALGSLMLTRDGQEFVAPAFSVDTVDTVAAGDAFTAALAIAWRLDDKTQVLRYANAAGAIATTKHGAQSAMPSAAEIEQLLKENP